MGRRPPQAPPEKPHAFQVRARGAGIAEAMRGRAGAREAAALGERAGGASSEGGRAGAREGGAGRGGRAWSAGGRKRRWGRRSEALGRGARPGGCGGGAGAPVRGGRGVGRQGGAGEGGAGGVRSRARRARRGTCREYRHVRRRVIGPPQPHGRPACLLGGYQSEGGGVSVQQRGAQRVQGALARAFHAPP